MSATAAEPLRDVRLLHDQRVPTRDVISLSADVYLPVGTRILVGLGQKAVAGETVLADLGGGPERAFRRI